MFEAETMLCIHQTLYLLPGHTGILHFPPTIAVRSGHVTEFPAIGN